jgi:hypothetical protein
MIFLIVKDFSAAIATIEHMVAIAAQQCASRARHAPIVAALPASGNALAGLAAA